MFDTKFAIVLREDLAVWQKLNVTAFLVSGVVAQFPSVIGQPYRDRAGNLYNPMSVQPVIVLSADRAAIRAIHHRALDRGVTTSIYVEEMFATGHDAANRAVVVEMIAEKKAAGVGLLGIFHDEEVRHAVADRIIDVTAFAPRIAA